MKSTKLPFPAADRVLEAVMEYGDAAYGAARACREREAVWRAASRKRAVAFSVVSGLLILGEDRVVSIASLAPEQVQ